MAEKKEEKNKGETKRCTAECRVPTNGKER